MNNKFHNHSCPRSDAEVQQRFHNEQDPEVTRCDNRYEINMRFIKMRTRQKRL